MSPALSSAFAEKSRGSVILGLIGAVDHRELLAQPSLDEALAYLQAIPRGFPNCFVLAQPGAGVAVVEACADKCVVRRVEQGSITHGNGIMASDFGSVQHCSRQQAMARLLPDVEAALPQIPLEDWGKRAAPLLASAPIHSEMSLCSMVFHGQRGGPHTMRYRLKKSSEGRLVDPHNDGWQEIVLG